MGTEKAKKLAMELNFSMTESEGRGSVVGFELPT
jgi:hypothetical protein